MLESLFNKAAGPQVNNLIEKRLQHRCFPVNIVKFLRTCILKKICERVRLNKVLFVSHKGLKEALFSEIILTVSTHLVIMKRFLVKVYSNSLFFVLFSSSAIITCTILMLFCDSYISDRV